MNMNTFTLITLAVAMFFAVSCQKSNDYSSTKELFKAMKAQNDGQWFQHFVFKQKTIFIDTAAVKTDSAIWYEAVSYPYYFRIDRDIENEEFTIYRNDSTYQFKQDSLVRHTDDPAVHLVFKGGLYFIPLEESLDKLEQYGFNTSVFRKDTFMGEPVYVIGSDEQQFWLHAHHFYCMRRISTTRSEKILDVMYDDFVRLGQGWVEQKVTFVFDGKKRMEEFYFDIKEKEDINTETFNPTKNHKWYLDY